MMLLTHRAHLAEAPPTVRREAQRQKASTAATTPWWKLPDTSMKILQHPGRFQEVAQFSVQTMGRFAVIGVIAVLVSMWVLTEPFYELSKRIRRGGKSGTNNKKLNKGKL
jgi:hypothetical protein